jgi:hypothetical protein
MLDAGLIFSPVSSAGDDADRVLVLVGRLVIDRSVAYSTLVESALEIGIGGRRLESALQCLFDGDLIEFNVGPTVQRVFLLQAGEDRLQLARVIDHDRNRAMVRLVVGGVILVGGTIAIAIGPDYVEWHWFLNHPNQLGLTGSAWVMLLGVAVAVSSRRARGTALAVLFAGALMVMLQIVGR